MFYCRTTVPAVCTADACPPEMVRRNVARWYYCKMILGTSPLNKVETLSCHNVLQAWSTVNKKLLPELTCGSNWCITRYTNVSRQLWLKGRAGVLLSEGRWFPWCACRSVFAQDNETQTAARMAAIAIGVWVDYCKSLWTKVVLVEWHEDMNQWHKKLWQRWAVIMFTNTWPMLSTTPPQKQIKTKSGFA